MVSGGMFEGLESRTLFSLNNFPTIGDLLNPNDSVVRLQTNFGDIDFELFDSAAPITVANFLKYVRDGDFDKTFFHRFAKDTSVTPAAPFVLQGGAFRLKSPTTTGPFNGTGPANQAWEQIPTDAAITNEFNQSNLVRTVAMARVGGQVNSATSQFFINLKNNAFLDNTDQGFTVFARVATEASWTVVQNIITNVTQTTSQSSPFNELPTQNSFTADAVNENQLVTIRDAEIIKPQGVNAFYSYRVYYPEGFAGGTINEDLPLGNPGSTTVNYQVIVRAETRDALPSPAADFWYRDKVISTGTIAPNRRGGIIISGSQNPANNLVPKQGKPYAIEVWATGPVSATLSHYDFGSATLENFTTQTATTWTLPNIKKASDQGDVIVWDNTSDLPAAVTVTFIPDGGGSPTVLNFTTEAFRRGGMAIASTSALADGNYSAVVTADRALVVASTHYKTTGAKGGATELGITGSGLTRAVLAMANSGASGSGIGDTISMLNTNMGVGAIVTVIARFSDGSPDFTITSAPSVIQPGSRSSFTLPDVSALQGKYFSILYTSSQPIFATTLHVEHNDLAANAFSYTAALHHDFAEGFMDGARAGTDLFENLGIFNPNGSFFGASQPQPANITVRFLFSDGFVLARDFTIAADANLFIDLSTYAPLLAQNANNRYFYSLDVVSDVPVVAMMRHYDTSLGGLQASGGDSSNGTQRGQITALNAL
jgi:cyclophilin family peptidyl-prolyl cis-trans isomerase